MEGGKTTIFQACFGVRMYLNTTLTVIIPQICTVLSVPCQREGAGGFLGYCSTAACGLEHQQPPACCSGVSLHPEAGLVWDSRCSQEEAMPTARDEQGFGRYGSPRSASSFRSSVPIHIVGMCCPDLGRCCVPVCRLVRAELWGCTGLGSLDGSA